MKPPKSFRLDPKLLAEAKAKGLNVTQIIEAALAKALKANKCPYCGHGL